jgi:hypothetical protein
MTIEMSGLHEALSAILWPNSRLMSSWLLELPKIFSSAGLTPMVLHMPWCNEDPRGVLWNVDVALATYQEMIDELDVRRPLSIADSTIADFRERLGRVAKEMRQGSAFNMQMITCVGEGFLKVDSGGSVSAICPMFRCPEPDPGGSSLVLANE